MFKQSLSQLAEQIVQHYSNIHSYVVPTEKIALTETGCLATGQNEFPLSREASEQFGRLIKVPVTFYLTLDPDLRALIFNRRFMSSASDMGMGRDIRIDVHQDGHIIGYDDPKLLRISPVKVMDVVNSRLPQGLSPKQIKVAHFDISLKRLQLSCYSPEMVTEPRPGDLINGGIDLIHYTTGELGTQVYCYLRHLICSNGAITHVCCDEKHVRARRLPNGRFDEKDMLEQIGLLLMEAWKQLDAKLNAVTDLLGKGRVSVDFLRQQRTRFSLNNRILRVIEEAIRQDEIGPSNTQYDWFNAISRVATHDERLSFRQCRTLSRMAGEFSQHTAHRCSQCGNWIVTQN